MDYLRVFPAYAGMSLVRTRADSGKSGFPRLRGDEPAALKLMRLWSMFSPPTRG